MKDRPFLRQPGEPVPEGPVRPTHLVTAGVTLGLLALALWGVFALDRMAGVPCRSYICSATPSVLIVPAFIATLLISGAVWKLARGGDD